jgi:hypothetical protein
MGGQTKQVNQILEDMLGVYVIEHQGSWDKNLPWDKFSYNISYQESLKMAPFNVLYGRRCRPHGLRERESSIAERVPTGGTTLPRRKA